MSNQRQVTREELIDRARRLRHNLTVPERRLWQSLRGRRLGGSKFRRQVVLGPYIVDFFHLGSGLIIEVDGESHADRGEYDRQRQTWLERKGFRLLRVSNDEVLAEIDNVLDAIVSALNQVASGEDSR